MQAVLTYLDFEAESIFFKKKMRQKEQTAIKNKRGKKEQTRVGESSKGLTRMHIFLASSGLY